MAYRYDGNFERTAEFAGRSPSQGQIPAGTTLNWYYDRVKLVEPAAVGKQRSRDREGRSLSGLCPGCRAKVIVSRDDDLLALEKPLEFKFSLHVNC